ncbi:MAG: Gldg family protein, partial [Candidatus Krumholzibacteria bacterium]|nr:Gldg family protein [Candidatus Krumholzibacteria bacterium]
MTSKNRYGKYYKFLVYLIVVVLINVAGLTLFFRTDLTSDGLYSLSEASREAVATLSEPLTISVFFTKNLPAPHNNTERYLHDLLEEYSVHSNDYFNYRFCNVSAEEGDISEEAKRNQQMAQNYGIYPIQIQNIEQDEVKFQKAYMGMVLIHGDVVDKIPAITSTEGLEYTITSKIDKMNSKISTLLNLREPIRVKLIFSSSLEYVAPQLRMNDLMKVPASIESVTGKLNDKYYGKLAFSRLDPTADPSLKDQISRYNILTLKWPSMKDKSGKEVLAEGWGSAGLIVEKGDKYETIPLIKVFNLPLFGTQYQLADMGRMEEKLSEVIDDVIDINKKIGYLSDHQTLSLAGRSPIPGQGQGEMENLSNFNRLVSGDYSVSSIRLKDEDIPEGIDCLILAGPREEFSDYALFQIDQFLMKGKSLAIFLDSFKEIMTQPNQTRINYTQGPIYAPINTGLEKLLAHYGAAVRKSYVLDKSCYEQQMPRIYGGGKQSVYFAPIIKNEFINKGPSFMKQIKALVTVKSSPVELKDDTIESNGLRGEVLFASSDESWEMSGRISLNPWEMRPPENSMDMSSQPLAVLIEGEFPSYFAGKPMPKKPVKEGESEDGDQADGGESKEERPGESL